MRWITQCIYRILGGRFFVVTQTHEYPDTVNKNTFLLDFVTFFIFSLIVCFWFTFKLRFYEKFRKGVQCVVHVPNINLSSWVS